MDFYKRQNNRRGAFAAHPVHERTLRDGNMVQRGKDCNRRWVTAGEHERMG